MSEKINKLATQHEVIGVKADCPHFSTVGNFCLRVENGMVRCDEYLECELKYIDALKEENEKLKEELASFMNGDYCAEGCKKMNNAFCDVHKGILKENEKLKKILQELEDLSLKTYDVADFQMYFDNLGGKNDDRQTTKIRTRTQFNRYIN